MSEVVSAPRDAALGETVQTALSHVALESLEHRYVEVMRELAAAPHLDGFKEQYERLHRLLRKSHDGEKRLLAKVHELRDELSSHHGKVESAIQLSHEDEESIATLRQEIEKAWAMADTAHTREKESREMIRTLKKQVAELDALVDHSAGLATGQEAYLRDLLTAKKELEESHSVLLAQTSRLRTEHCGRTVKLQACMEEEASVRVELEERLQAYHTLLQELEEQQRARNASEHRVREYRSTMESFVADLEKRKGQLEHLSEEEARLKKEAADTDEAAQTCARQLEEKQRRFQTEADRLSSVEHHNRKLRDTIPQRMTVLREKQVMATQSKKSLTEVEHAAVSQQNELQRLVEERERLVSKRTEYAEEINALAAVLAKEEKELYGLKADVVAAMSRKSKVQSENTLRENERANAEGQRVLEEGRYRSLSQQLETLLVANETRRKEVFRLEKSQGKELGAAQGTLLSYHKTLDHIRAKRAEARSLRDVLTEHEQKQKTQQELLDRVNAERNRTEKQLRETEKELAQMKHKHSEKMEEIEFMKVELIEKEGALCQLHTLRKQLQMDVAGTEQRANHLKEDCTHARSRTDALQAEALQLQQIIANCDAEKAKQQMRLNVLINERNVLATQVIRRSEELQLLYDKIQLQQGSLDKGALGYDQCVRDISELRDQLVELRIRCRLALVRLRYVEQLKKKQLQAERAVARERARVRALTEELHNPVNVHRWRKFEGSAPGLLDALAKVQVLQGKLLRKNDECEEKASKILHTEAECERLRQKLARLPGPEAAEDLALFHENVTQRAQQTEEMSQELHNVEQHAEALADEVQQLSREILSAKRNYFDAKTKYDALRREKAVFYQTWGGSAALVRRKRKQRGFQGDVGDAFISASATMPPATANVSNSRDAHPVLRSEQENSSTQMRLSASSRRPVRDDLSRKQRILHEEALAHSLLTGIPAPNIPLQKPKQQRQFAGGGFCLTRR